MKKLLALTLAVLMLTSVALAEQIGDVTLPDSLMAGKDTLLLNGAGFRKKVFIKVYAGGLYLKQKQTDPQKIIALDEPLQLFLFKKKLQPFGALDGVGF